MKFYLVPLLAFLALALFGAVLTISASATPIQGKIGDEGPQVVYNTPFVPGPTPTDQPPAVSFTESPAACSGTYQLSQLISISIISSDPDGSVTAIAVSWGDGIIDHLPGTATNDSHAYFAAGSYAVYVNATDNAGLTTKSSVTTNTIVARSSGVSFTESATTAMTGQPITLSISVNSPCGQATKITVAWGDGLVDSLFGNATSDSHSYKTAGSYAVKVNATYNTGFSESTRSAKTITDRPPVAHFTETSTTALTGVPINFNATASFDPDGTIVSYSWNFGDGSPLGTGATISHTYSSQGGTYTVVLTVTDDSGNTGSTTSVKTSPTPPFAKFTEDNTGVLTGVVINFNATMSTDPDGTIVNYAWNFGDGNTDNGLTTTHSYSAAGAYTVTLTITDNSGGTATATSKKTIQDRPPVASFTESATTVPVGSTISFNATSSYDPDGTIVNYAWNFGDTTMGTGATITHAYSNGGTFTVRLDVTDNSGSLASAFSIKSTCLSPPVVGFQENASTALTFQTFALSVIFAQDCGGASPSKTSVDWADGTVHSFIGVPTGDTHSYSTAGAYTVVLTATFSDGSIGSASSVKTVQDRPPFATFNFKPGTPVIGHMVIFDGSSSTDPDGTLTGYSWDFGDGTKGTGAITTHAYVGSGNYTVVLTVTDNSGSVAIARTTLKVFNHLPGDVDDDCHVDITDLSVVGASFGSTPSSPNWNPNADLNHDGKVDLLDLVIVGSNFGRSCK